MTRTRTTHVTLKNRRRTAIATTAGALGAALVAVAVTGATSALWRTELTAQAALPDAAVLFTVNGEDATASVPTVAVTLGTAETQALLDEGRIALPIEVESLSQGNRGLRYSITLPTTQESDILHWADVTVFPVTAQAQCTVDTEAPILPPSTSTPVPATYSDGTTPVTEHWCLQAELGQLPDVGVYTSTATITGTHALGEIVATQPWNIDVATAFTAANEPTHRIEFTYETFRDGAER